ncbi:hypothetical protein PAI11_28010 [Patulibacter medicamentivorans]|uniref:Uncharacterized protein n=1 Tax=Patulibacter medicamentivorans TaxID=1097667 RepID=H0E7J9_9ACTN|nr:hypothetical protein [Patulibacter medicamentivorans]EHN10334.1 hypothetical protein PAI11_28010 [Patulibacter medicamentivorans]
MSTDQVERAVLLRLLDCLPIHLTIEEVVREVADASDEFGPRDEATNAIGALVRAGLAYRHGAFVVPSRAATRFATITEV